MRTHGFYSSESAVFFCIPLFPRRFPSLEIPFCSRAREDHLPQGVVAAHRDLFEASSLVLAAFFFCFWFLTPQVLRTLPAALLVRDCSFADTAFFFPE